MFKKTKNKSNKPLLALAPMADVTDSAFRKVIAKYGKPDLMWTEFVSADGLIRATPEGKKKLLADLKFDKSERPIIAQLFGSNPKYMEEACALVAKLGYDGIDINMGCPDRSIERQKSGAAMIKNPKLAQEIILAAKRGAPKLPISVKTRMGYNKNELETWLPALLEVNPAIITVHARTRKEMSKVPANWDYVKRAVEIRDEVQGLRGQAHTGAQKTLIFGNGDVKSVEEAYARAKETGADGVMIGRAVFGNPWLFSGVSIEKNSKKISIKDKLKVMVEHTKLFEKYLSGSKIKNFAVMKKHYKAYVTGFDGAHELRKELMENANNAKDVEGIVGRFLKQKAPKGAFCRLG